MALNREGIYAAILVKLQAVAGLGELGATRRYLDLAKVQPSQQPCLMLITGSETAEHRIGLPAKWTLRPTVVLYARTDSETGTVPNATLATLLTAVELALEWSSGDTPFAAPLAGAGSLGALCVYCRIVSIDVGEGIESGQAMAAVNLEILTFGAA